MFQLITRARSFPASPITPESGTSTSSLTDEDERIQAPLREFLGNIVELMNRSANINSGASIVRLPEGSIIAEDLEALLNDFFSRAFGGMESAPRGLTPERINALPLMEEGAELDCAICRETATAGAEKCVKLPCDHGFHFDCIEPWLKRVSSCPICRNEIKE